MSTVKNDLVLLSCMTNSKYAPGRHYTCSTLHFTASLSLLAADRLALSDAVDGLGEEEHEEHHDTKSTSV